MEEADKTTLWGSTSYKKLEFDGHLFFKLKDSLNLNSIDLDSRNTDGMGVNSTEAPDHVQGKSPLYRITGSRLKFAIHVSNFRYQEKMFDNTVLVRAVITQESDRDDSQLTWACKGFSMMDYNFNGKDVTADFSFEKSS